MTDRNVSSIIEVEIHLFFTFPPSQKGILPNEIEDLLNFVDTSAQRFGPVRTGRSVKDRTVSAWTGSDGHHAAAELPHGRVL